MERRKFLTTILKATVLAPVAMAVPKVLAIGVAPAAPKNLRIVKIKSRDAVTAFIDALDRGSREEIDAWMALKSGQIGYIDGFTFYETMDPRFYASSFVKPTEPYDIYPGKVWGTSAIEPIQVCQNKVNEIYFNMVNETYQKMIDEAFGVPEYMLGPPGPSKYSTASEILWNDRLGRVEIRNVPNIHVNPYKHEIGAKP